MPSCRFKHLEGDAMDGQLLRNAGVAKADAIIVGNAHDADPKDVSLLLCMLSFPHGQGHAVQLELVLRAFFCTFCGLLHSSDMQTCKHIAAAAAAASFTTADGRLGADSYCCFHSSTVLSKPPKCTQVNPEKLP